MTETHSPTTQKILQTDIAELLGLDALTELERYAYLSDIADTIFEGAVQRFLQDLPEDKLEAFNAFLESPEAQADENALAQYLTTHHPEFEQVLEDEIIDFRKDALELLGNAPDEGTSQSTNAEQVEN